MATFKDMLDNAVDAAKTQLGDKDKIMETVKEKAPEVLAIVKEKAPGVLDAVKDKAPDALKGLIDKIG